MIYEHRDSPVSDPQKLDQYVEAILAKQTAEQRHRFHYNPNKAKLDLCTIDFLYPEDKKTYLLPDLEEVNVS